MEQKKITIFDVAKRAGVSKGTVDRVLHNRGEVSKKSADKVREAIKDLNYEPNMYASLLATKKNREIACLIPKFKAGEYWSKIYDGIVAGKEYAETFKVELAYFFYDQYDPDSFVEASQKLLKSNPSGVIIPPLFRQLTSDFVMELKERDIPYVYVDTKLEEGSYLAYFGMPMYKSGYLCANLLTARRKESEVKEILIVRILRDKSSLSDPTIARRSGFIDYIDTYFPECVVYSLFINPQDKESINKTLGDFYKKHPGIKNIVMFNSRVYLIADFLKQHPDADRCVIGYDNLDANMSALRQGVVSALLSQHTEFQSRNAVIALTDYVVVKKQPQNRDCYMHTDILTALNMENY